jgi:hypothetical protein
MTKREAYLEFLGIFNSGVVELLANERAIEQTCSLQRRTGRSGRDSVDARGGAPEDAANVIAAVCAMIEKHSRRYVRYTALPSRPGEFHPEPLTDSGREPLDSSGSCHRAKAAAFGGATAIDTAGKLRPSQRP